MSEETGKPTLWRQNPGKFSMVEYIGIINNVLMGLEAIHGQQLVHRDIKPDNIKYDPRTKVPIIMDFGLVKSLRQADAALTTHALTTGAGEAGDGESSWGKTRAGSMMGTPGYMSPEQTADAAGVDQRTDLFAVGVMLYEFLTGERPFEGRNVHETLSLVLTEAPPPASKLNRAIDRKLEGLILKGLEKDPADRFQSAGEMKMALEEYVKQAEAARAGTPAGARPKKILRVPKKVTSPVEPPLDGVPPDVAGAPTMVAGEAAEEPPVGGDWSMHAPVRDTAAEDEGGEALAIETRARDQTQRETWLRPRSIGIAAGVLAVAAVVISALVVGRTKGPPVPETAPAIGTASVPGTPSGAPGTWKVYTEWPFDAAEAKRRQKETADALGVPVERNINIGGVDMPMVLIPAGEFMMGSPDTEKDRQTNEGPTHRVRISTPLYLGKYELTQEIWERVMKSNPVVFKAPKNPVENVNWEDCEAFAKKLTDSTKGQAEFRLPTEAESEYACRAGTDTRFYFGDDPDYGELPNHGWYSGNADGRTHPVGQLKPNAWGLYDMGGNVWEWCQDWYGPYAKDVAQTDPKGPDTGSARVLRGGSWNYGPGLCRSAIRAHAVPDCRLSHHGFRVVVRWGLPSAAGAQAVAAVEKAAIPRVREPALSSSPVQPVAVIPAIAAGDMSGFSRKMQIAFSGYTRSERLINFPALVVFSESGMPGFRYGDFASPGGWDLRFTDAEGKRELPYEIEKWDAGGNSYVWVQIPALAANTAIYAYWGNKSAVQASYTTNGGVWDSGYVGVWHMNQPDARDSTAFMNNGKAVGSVSVTRGMAGDACDFAGAGQHVHCSDSDSLDLATTGTAETWVYLRKTGAAAGFVGKGANGEDWSAYSYALQVQGLSDTRLCLWAYDNTGHDFKIFGPADYSMRAWHYLAAAFKPGEAGYFFNGQICQRVVANVTLRNSTGGLNLGSQLDTGKYCMDGLLDEVRISNVSRSSDWLWATWMNIASNSAFNSYGKPMPISGPTTGALAPTPKEGPVSVTGIEVPRPDAKWTVYTQWPFDAAEAKRRQKETAEALGLPVEKNVKIGGLDMAMVLIPAGEFVMGGKDSVEDLIRRTGENRRDWWEREQGQHRVRITKPFYLGKEEVSQGIWEKVMKVNPSAFKDLKHPVEQVSWEDCQLFLSKLTALTKGQGEFRLLTEAEWEWACRAGTVASFYFGERIGDNQANWNGEKGGWDGQKGKNLGHSTPAGAYAANPWGLYDMAGNVWEWCQDWHGPYVRDVLLVDPQGSERGHARVIRGGSWRDPVPWCRSSARYELGPATRHNDTGLRVLLVVPSRGRDAASATTQRPNMTMPSVDSLLTPEERLNAYREKLNRAWPQYKPGYWLQLETNGGFALNLTQGPVADLSPLQSLPLVSLTLKSDKVSSLSPLVGMPLTSLSLHGCGNVNDLSPLKGMPLTSLSLRGCGKVSDLSPLTGKPLTTLVLYGCGKVGDLLPLKAMPLTSLDVARCSQINDLSPLKGMPLTFLHLGWCSNVADLSPLKGMPLTNLCLRSCSSISDLSPLTGMPLTWLDLGSCGKISDLSPLIGMALTSLDLEWCFVKDLSPLRGMPLTSLNLTGERFRDLRPLLDCPKLEHIITAERDIEYLRSKPGLLTINGIRVKDFWERFDKEKAQAPAVSAPPLSRVQAGSRVEVKGSTLQTNMVLSATAGVHLSADESLNDHMLNHSSGMIAGTITRTIAGRFTNSTLTISWNGISGGLDLNGNKLACTEGMDHWHSGCSLVLDLGDGSALGAISNTGGTGTNGIMSTSGAGADAATGSITITNAGNITVGMIDTVNRERYPGVMTSGSLRVEQHGSFNAYRVRTGRSGAQTFAGDDTGVFRIAGGMEAIGSKADITINDYVTVEVKGGIHTGGVSAGTHNAGIGKIRIGEASNPIAGDITIEGGIDASNTKSEDGCGSTLVSLYAAGAIRLVGEIDMRKNTSGTSFPDGSLMLNSTSGAIIVEQLDMGRIRSTTFSAGSGKSYITGALDNFDTSNSKTQKSLDASTGQIIYYKYKQGGMNGYLGGRNYSLPSGGELRPEE